MVKMSISDNRTTKHQCQGSRHWHDIEPLLINSHKVRVCFGSFTDDLWCQKISMSRWCQPAQYNQRLKSMNFRYHKKIRRWMMASDCLFEHFVFKMSIDIHVYKHKSYYISYTKLLLCDYRQYDYFSDLKLLSLFSISVVICVDPSILNNLNITVSQQIHHVMNFTVIVIERLTMLMVHRYDPLSFTYEMVIWICNVGRYTS